MNFSLFFLVFRGFSFCTRQNSGTAEDITGHPKALFLPFIVFVHALTMPLIPSAESQQPSG